MRLQYLTDDGIQYLKGNFETNLPHYIQKDSAFFAKMLKEHDFLQDTGYDFNPFVTNLQVTGDESAGMKRFGITRTRYTILSSPIRDMASVGEPSLIVWPVCTGALRWSTPQTIEMILMDCSGKLLRQAILVQLSYSRPVVSSVGERRASVFSRQSTNCAWRKNGMLTVRLSSQVSNTSTSLQDSACLTCVPRKR